MKVTTSGWFFGTSGFYCSLVLPHLTINVFSDLIEVKDYSLPWIRLYRRI